MSQSAVGLRREARRVAMTAVYASDVTGYTIAEVLEMMRDMRADWHTLPEFAEQLARKVVEHAAVIEEEIAAILQNWKIERVAPVEKALLKLGCAEILFYADIPPRVTINEYIEMAKTFANENAPAFINGILDKLVQNQNKADFHAAKQD